MHTHRITSIPSSYYYYYANMHQTYFILFISDVPSTSNFYTYLNVNVVNAVYVLYIIQLQRHGKCHRSSNNSAKENLHFSCIPFQFFLYLFNVAG